MSEGNDAAKIKQYAEYNEAKSYIKYKQTLGGLLSFNMENGYLEARVRGFRSGFLTPADYRQLMQCEKLSEVKLALSDTDYGPLLTGLGNPPVEDGKVSGAEARKIVKMRQEYVTTLKRILHQKFEDEFTFMRQNAVGPLMSFLDFMTYDKMIDNFALLMTGMGKSAKRNASGEDRQRAVEKKIADLKPLGMFPNLKTISALAGDQESSETLMDLYELVLVETPISKYFEQFLMPEQRKEGEEAQAQIESFLQEQQMDIIKNQVRRYWLEDFKGYCDSLGGDTAEMMAALLGLEADLTTISITRHSFANKLGKPTERVNRAKLFPKFGSLYPELHFDITGDTNKMGSQNPGVGNEDQLRSVLQKSSYIFKERLSQSLGAEGKADYDYLSTRIRADAAQLAFDGQSHFAVFYAYMTLKEIELDNLDLIVSTIAEGEKLEPHQKANRKKMVETMIVKIFDPEMYKR